MPRIWPENGLLQRQGHNVQDGDLRIESAGTMPRLSVYFKGQWYVGALELTMYRDQPYGYAGLGSDGKVPTSLLPPGQGGGEANTASNVGQSGIGIFKVKDGVDLEFKNVAVSAPATILDDTGTDRVVVSVAVGTGAGTVCAGDDTRLSDARAPLSHGHSIGDVTGLTSALAVTVVEGDPRLTDARTPLAHTHAQADVTNLVSALAGKAATSHAHVTSDVTGLDTALTARQVTSEKGQANGYASLGADGKVPAGQLPAAGGGGSGMAIESVALLVGI